MLPLAAAIELIHTYSLIHDDLPAMDDDDLRRGRPDLPRRASARTSRSSPATACTPRRSGSCSPSRPASPPRVLAAVRELAAATGVDGMVGGQYLDVAGTAPAGAAALRRLHELKTGRLIGASVECVLLLAGAERTCDNRAIARFAAELGVLFQIVDDILDVTGTDAELGKPQRQRRAARQAHLRERVRPRRGAGAGRGVARARPARRWPRRPRTARRELEQITDFILTRTS